MNLFLFIAGIVSLPFILIALANRQFAVGATIVILFFALTMSGLSGWHVFINGILFIPLLLLYGSILFIVLRKLFILAKKALRVWTDPVYKVDSEVNKKTMILIIAPIVIFIISIVISAAILLSNPKLSSLLN